MKGKISLKKFIGEVKKELQDSIDEDDPFFLLDKVELETSFKLDVDTKGKVKLLVFEAGAGAKASQMHKVKLVLTPFVENRESLPSPGRSGKILGKDPFPEVTSKKKRSGKKRKPILKRKR